MTDERDICERLEDRNIDGAIFLRINAAKDIRALRHYVAQLEHDLAEEEHQHAKTISKLRKARDHIEYQALDIITLGQEVGRLREALEKIIYLEQPQVRGLPRRVSLSEIARAALAEKKEK